MDELSELIQCDLCTLLDGFNVGHLTNEQGVTLIDLACQIIVDRFNEAA